MGNGEPQERAKEAEYAVEVSDDEFDALLQAVFTHAETARRFAEAKKAGSWVWKEAGLEGADRASLEIMEKLMDERQRTGKCTRGHANQPYFMKLWMYRRLDAYDRMTAPARTARESDEEQSVVEDRPGRRPRTELVGLWNDPVAAVSHEPPRKTETRPGYLEPIIVELIPRVMEVLAARGSSGAPRRTKLTPQQHEATLFSMAVSNGLIDYLESEQVAFLDSLPDRGALWKRDLASRWRNLETGTSHIDQSAVSRAIKRGAEQVQLCTYLFTTLAPRRHAVTEPQAMHRLLDILDRPADVRHPAPERLGSAERKRLRIAGETCVPHHDDFVVDIETYLGKTLGEESADEEARRLGLEALHASEERFAVLVPEQTSPPQFSCVLQCTTHSPTINERES